MSHENVIEEAKKGKVAAKVLLSASSDLKNEALLKMAEALENNREQIIKANDEDRKEAEKDLATGELSNSLFKRLLLDDSKIISMVEGLKSIVKLEDPVGKELMRLELDEGLILSKVTTPIGLLGIIFESRPDVVPQIMGLSVKSGNAVFFKGGKEALHTNRVLFNLLYQAGMSVGLPANFSSLMETREDVSGILDLDEYFDLLIPRGSNELVKHIKENTKIPVLGHTDGICTMYVEKTADFKMAVGLVVDSKTQYPAVCNAIENLLIDEQIVSDFLPLVVEALRAKGVELFGSKAVTVLDSSIGEATTDEWAKEYNDLILSIDVVSDIEAAINFINLYGSGHTDAIVTASEEKATRFQNNVDSSSVMVNASTRFADGFRYGMGAEIGISTNKTHARGPVGLEGMVIYKFKLTGNGHLVKDYIEPGKFSHRLLK